MWITSGPGQKSCTQHDVTFAATRSCPQCAGPARLNQLDDNGDRVDPFPEPTHDERLRVAAVGYMACNGGDGYTMVDASREACTALAQAPRTVDLLMAYVAGMPNSRIVQPPIPGDAVS